MLTKEEIVILHTVKHSDKGIVVNGYSSKYGRSSYYYYVSKKNGGTIHLAPLTILETVVFYKHAQGVGGSGLPIIKEMEPSVKLHSLRSNIHKSAIAIFICELIYQSIREIEPNINLHKFIVTSTQILEELEEGVENFHLYFIANFCKVMGYMPYNNYSAEYKHFNFIQGQYIESYSEENCFSPINSQLLNRVLTTPISELKNINCNGKGRSDFLEEMIKYIEYHTQTLLHLKSLTVLSEIFS